MTQNKIMYMIGTLLQVGMGQFYTHPSDLFHWDWFALGRWHFCYVDLTGGGGAACKGPFLSPIAVAKGLILAEVP